jgi:hypothetical protein
MSESFGRGESALFLANPELASAARRQRFAEELLGQAVKPRNVGGHAGGLAQMGQALIAGYMGYREDEKIRALAEAQRAREDEEVRALMGGAMPAGQAVPATQSALATPPGSLPPPVPIAPEGGEVPPMATALMNPPGQPGQPAQGGAAPGMPMPPPVLAGGAAQPGGLPAMAQPGGGVNMQAIIAGMSSSSPRVRATAQMLFQQARDQEERALRLQDREEERRFRLQLAGASRAPVEPRPVTMAPGQALVDPASGRVIAERPPTPAEPRQSDIERKIDLMVQNGVPREMATGLATGQFETRQDPQDGSITIIDRSNGRILFGPNAGGIIGQPAAPAAPGAPLVRGPRMDGVAPGAPGAPGSTFPPNADFRGATGAPGLIAETANLVADLFGGRNLPAPERAAGAQALRNLDTRTRMFLQSAIPGRPSNYLMEMIGGLTVSPAEIRLGPERATERVQQTSRFLEQTVRELEEIAGGQGTGRFTRQDIGEANRVLVSLRPLLNDYRTLEGALTRQPERAPPPPRRGTIGNRPAPPEGEIRTPSGLTLRPIQ